MTWRRFCSWFWGVFYSFTLVLALFVLFWLVTDRGHHRGTFATSPGIDVSNHPGSSFQPGFTAVPVEGGMARLPAF